MAEMAGSQLWYHRRPALLGVLGITLAVLLITLFLSIGYGLTTTGDQAIAYLNRDLWLSGGSLALAPGSVGGVENPIQNSHAVARDLEARPAIESATPLAFQAVYVSPNTSEFQTLVGVGVGANTRSGGIDQRVSAFSRGDVHYANGSYDGPMTHEVILSPQAAEQFGVGVNDTLYIGGTLTQARANRFRVVSVQQNFARFLGTPTVTLPLSELQEVTGTTGQDRAAIIGVTLRSGADPQTVGQAIERDYPTLEARTNNEQIQQIIGRQASLVVGAVALVGLALVAGLVLIVNVLGLLVYQQRTELAALKAAGVSSRLLIGTVLIQGVIIGASGGIIGVGLTLPAVSAVNGVTEAISGFPNLLKAPPWVLGAGLLIAIVMGIIGATVAGRQVSLVEPLEVLE